MFELWDQYGFNILVLLSIGFILVLCLLRIGKKGTWNQYELEYKNKVPEKPSGRGGFESKGERECRRVLEKIFRIPFPKARPDFLRNAVTGGKHNLELDCFSPQVGVACEYNGFQKTVIFIENTI